MLRAAPAQRLTTGCPAGWEMRQQAERHLSFVCAWRASPCKCRQVNQQHVIRRLLLHVLLLLLLLGVSISQLFKGSALVMACGHQRSNGMGHNNINLVTPQSD